jgi:DNA (cytosine-5)-methyltransferase 1
MKRDGTQGTAGKGALVGDDVAFTVAATQDQTLIDGYVVRRLTPRECERLQGFPDDWTLIDFKGKPAPDGRRYKAIGNSWAVPCARWVGERIDMVDKLMEEVR